MTNIYNSYYVKQTMGEILMILNTQEATFTERLPDPSPKPLKTSGYDTNKLFI